MQASFAAKSTESDGEVDFSESGGEVRGVLLTLRLRLSPDLKSEMVVEGAAAIRATQIGSDERTQFDFLVNHPGLLRAPFFRVVTLR